MSAQEDVIALEEAVLGGVMNDASILSLCRLSARDFLVSSHRHAWDAIQRLARAGQAVDALSLAEQLYSDRAPVPKAGWLETLGKISRETASTKTTPAYADRLRSKSILRQAQVIGREIGALENLDVLDSKIRALIELQGGTAEHTYHIEQAMAAAIDAMDAAGTHITTGLLDLDEALGGFHPEDLIVVGARPAMGKTAFMLNLALAPEVPIGIISGEQGRDQIGMRTIAINASINLHRLRKGALSDDEWARLNACITRAKQRKIWLYDRPAPTIADVVRQARAWAYEKKIALLLVDYLQKIRGDGENRRLQVGDVASQLKDLARELKIPIVALAQVGRHVETREMGPDGLGRMPFMGDLKESGDIEQEADQILTLYRPGVYDQDPRYKGLAYINICKNRHGPEGYKQATWRGEYLQFHNFAEWESGSGDRWSHAP